MFYKTEKNDHGLPYNPFKAIVSPRPIGWISTVDANGRPNLAPYSFFNGISDTPPMIGFSSAAHKPGTTEAKDSPTNIAETGAFCVNFVSSALKDQMNITSGHYDHGDDEFELANLTKEMGRVVNVPYVAEAPAVFECAHYQTLELPGGNLWVMGSVVAVHINDDVIRDGKVDVTAYEPLARLGYKDYASITTTFELTRPSEK
jgi:flavin reductase (DIM6/NTAB) family NADH-FMN oxidoreductase RutF